jgi:hypothetical protein
MVSVTYLNIGLPLRAATVPVEPPRALLGLRFGEVWAYPRASLFFRLARRQDPLQTDCHWRPLDRLGNPSSPSQSSSSFGWCLSYGLSGLLFARASAGFMDEPLNL